LTEIAFISNPEEEALMEQDSWDDKVASAICRGFSRAMGVPYIEWKGESDVLEVAVLLNTKDDSWAGFDVAAVNGNCAVFVRGADRSVPKDAMSAKQLFVVGGPTVNHPNEVLLSGKTKFDTAAAVGKYLE
jgi:hypothetical protein